MLIFKFTKTRSAALVAHVDNLRAITYLFRRAGISAEYSQGYNPHMELGFSPPLALGVESLAEYVSVKTASTEFPLDKLNAASPAGLRFVKQFNAEVNLAAVLNRAQYRLEAKGLGDAVQASDMTSRGYMITYTDKSGEVTKDVSSKIYLAQRESADSALVTLAMGNDNLRPDRLVLDLMRKNSLEGDYRITKLAAFADDIPADDFIAQKISV